MNTGVYIVPRKHLVLIYHISLTWKLIYIKASQSKHTITCKVIIIEMLSLSEIESSQNSLYAALDLETPIDVEFAM